MENGNNRISLFGDPGEKAVMPTIGKSDNTESEGIVDGVNLKSDGIEKAILGETVKSLMIPESLELLLPNYVLDFREAKALRKHQIHSLAALLDDAGDTSIYVCLGNGMEKLGCGDGIKLDSILNIGISSIFGKQCKVYRNVERDKPVKEVKNFDPNSIRLDL